MNTDNFLLVGITGGIGSGKSLVCRILEVLGIPVYNADARAKWLLAHDEPLKSAVIKNFGEEAYGADGQLNRQFLAGKVFNDSGQVEILNQLVHPRVGQDFNQWVTRQRDAAYLVKEAALLFESGSYKTLDQVITINAPEAIRIKRVCFGTGIEKKRMLKPSWKSNSPIKKGLNWQIL